MDTEIPINILSQYNFNLNIVLFFGLENEFDAANFDTWATSKSKKTDEAIYSQFFDYQFRPLNKLYWDKKLIVSLCP